MKKTFLDFTIGASEVLNEAWTKGGEHDKSVERDWIDSVRTKPENDINQYISSKGTLKINNIDKVRENELQSIISKLAHIYTFTIEGKYVSLPYLGAGLRKIRTALENSLDIKLSKK